MVSLADGNSEAMRVPRCVRCCETSFEGRYGSDRRFEAGFFWWPMSVQGRNRTDKGKHRISGSPEMRSMSAISLIPFSMSCLPMAVV